ncbi:helix-turn-helix domain-containing protein [Cryptosporangium arvum]|uniref:helix-turn-helix domain-containing protein n=1 Tax=Cryptosporangium arvum TaxID=80871 RepID=UPI0004B84966|nr:helix-turn-helix domain-containing protein [Cryptosporangium arvum]
MPIQRGVVDGAFRVLHALPGVGPRQQVARLARATGLPRPTVYRLLDQLTEVGAVERRDGRWTLAAGMLGLARSVEPVAGLRVHAMAAIRELRELTGGAVSLVVPRAEDFVALEMVPGREALPIDARAGADMPASTAAGQVLRPTGRRHVGKAVVHGPELGGVTCYAVPIVLPGGARAALQVATSVRPAERFAAPVHRAAIALERRVAAAGH